MTRRFLGEKKDLTIHCSKCPAKFCDPRPITVTGMRGWARSFGWIAKCGEPYICPKCVLADDSIVLSTAPRIGPEQSVQAAKRRAMATVALPPPPKPLVHDDRRAGKTLASLKTAFHFAAKGQSVLYVMHQLAIKDIEALVRSPEMRQWKDAISEFRMEPPRVKLRGGGSITFASQAERGFTRMILDHTLYESGLKGSAWTNGITDRADRFG